MPVFAPESESTMPMRRVIVESPYAGKTEAEISRNVDYARACVRDCILRGEAPFASHLLYTQPGVLADAIAEERSLGMRAGFSWVEVAEATIVYTDLGILRGMKAGIAQAERHGKPVEYRTLPRRSKDEPIDPG